MSDVSNNLRDILSVHLYAKEIEMFDEITQGRFTKSQKTLVEAVVDKCKEEATAIEGYNTGFSGSAASVDKQSIDNVKTMVKYE